MSCAIKPSRVLPTTLVDVNPQSFTPENLEDELNLLRAQMKLMLKNVNVGTRQTVNYTLDFVDGVAVIGDDELSFNAATVLIYDLYSTAHLWLRGYRSAAQMNMDTRVSPTDVIATIPGLTLDLEFNPVDQLIFPNGVVLPSDAPELSPLLKVVALDPGLRSAQLNVTFLVMESLKAGG